MGCSLINGGYGYPFFTPTIHKYIVGTPVQNLTASANHVPSLEIRDFLAKVNPPTMDNTVVLWKSKVIATIVKIKLSISADQCS